MEQERQVTARLERLTGYSAVLYAAVVPKTRLYAGPTGRELAMAEAMNWVERRREEAVAQIFTWRLREIYP